MLPLIEADDFVAAAVAAEEQRGGTVLAASGDRDTFQLASDKTTVLYPVRAGEMAPLVLLEGHARLTAYALAPEYVPAELPVLLGTSPGFLRWGCY